VLARQLLTESGIVPAPDTLEPAVRALLTKLEATELDAALVYATDVIDSDQVEGIDTPLITTDYTIATLSDSDEPDAAQAFVDFVLSPAGQQILAAHGFITP
jgi:molybdate transport system substrate-binding protein